ncbi:LysR family transcriptional regulator [Reinekea forsetii]|nr:LysR family transcriptional regulator [Reinekea forsetii]
MDKIDAMKAFMAVVNEGSFTRAAAKLATSNQVVSKQVAQLENHLGARLFNRTTRKVHLTEAGQQCVPLAQEILERLRDMEGSLGMLVDQAQGLLRISAPVSFATRYLTPLVRDFKRENPAVGIDIQVSDRKVDLVEEGYDLALRIGNLKDSSLVAKKIAPVNLVMCASPGYLEKMGEPMHPKDLNPKHYLRYSYMENYSSSSALMAALSKASKASDSSFSANIGDVLVDAAIAGDGYALQPTFMVADAIKRGELVVFLKEFQPQPLGLYLVYPHRKLLANKLRKFIDFSASYYGTPPVWDDYEK